MKTLINKAAWVCLSCTIISFNAVAQDIDLYLGNSSGAALNVRPNILFVVDTSTSMGNDMEITIPETTGSSGANFEKLVNQTFDSGVEGWDSSVTNESHKMEIRQDVITTQMFDFGVARANTSVTLKLDLNITEFWENEGASRDYFEITANGIVVSRKSYDDPSEDEDEDGDNSDDNNSQDAEDSDGVDTDGDGNDDDFNDNDSAHVQVSFDLDAAGQVILTLMPDTTHADEYARVDNLTIGLTAVENPFSYNSANTYPGCFDTTKIYFSEDREDLECTATKDDKHYYFATDNKCNYLATRLTNNGYGTGIRGGFYRTDKGKWIELDDHFSGQYVFECENDSGVHGETAGSANVYAAKASKGGPWSSSNSNEIDWGDDFDSDNHYSGNYLNYMDCVDADGCSFSTTTTTTLETVTRSRLQLAQYVINDILDTTSDINVGLMRFDSRSNGGYVVTAMDNIANNKAAFKAELNNLEAKGGTPLSESLYESYLYFKGENMRHGLQPKGNDYDDDTTDAAAHIANTYQSPIEYQCQKSFVVVLTDGAPSNDTGDDAQIAGLTGFEGITGSAACNGNCLDEISKMMFETDMSSTLATNQVISTYAIAMGDDLDADDIALLEKTVSNGGGAYYYANAYDKMMTAFTNILNEIRSVNSSFTSPAISVNAFSKTTNRNDLYYSLFKPKHGPHWTGNLKKFQLKVINGVSTIVGLDNKPAIDPKTGYFYNDAQSFWLTADQQKDGGEVTQGGAAAKIPLDRTVYTNIAGSDLTSASNIVNVSNAVALKAFINPSLTTAEVETIIGWVRGKDVKNERGLAPTAVARMEMADPLHTRPVVVQYGGTEANPIQTIFTSNNDGFLNAIDETTGVLQYSFIPKELLTNLDVLFDDNSSVKRTYGLDGFITAKVTDANANGIIDGTDKAILYIGMRRGGRNYYALDVTNRDNPQLLWTINGGTGDFTELGQTWSKPLAKKIKFNGVLKDVVIFSGGYDGNQDTNNVHDNDTQGRAIYIVDGLTGTRLWWAGPVGSGANVEMAELTNSIPASVYAPDVIPGNGVSRIYAADTRGQILRFDINGRNTGAGNLVQMSYRLAKLSGEGVTADTRRFYYEPSGVLLNGHVALLIGSGYRANPLEINEQNRIYMIKDANTFRSPRRAPRTITEQDLVNVTTLPTSELAQSRRTRALSGSKGWYFDLAAGEKVLAKPVITSNVGLITTFTPNTGVAATACSPGQGGGKVYYVNLEDATPALDLSRDGTKDISDRSTEIKGAGLPSPPVRIVGPTGKITTLIDKTVSRNADDSDSAIKKTYWYEDKTGALIRTIPNVR